ncbi:unnamed protein product [Closterium sp. NIES-54]
MGSQQHLFTVGSKVWVPDAADAWEEGEVVARDRGSSQLTVALGTGGKGQVVVGEGECYAREEESAVVDDMVKLAYLHEPGVLHNLMQRYHRNLIYTYTGSILIAANPFMRLPGIYDRDMRDAYRGQPLGELSPHVFAIADNAYRAMCEASQRAEHMGSLIPPPRAPSPRAPSPRAPSPRAPSPHAPSPHARPLVPAPPSPPPLPRPPHHLRPPSHGRHP